METISNILGPIEGKEKKQKVDWPEKGDFLVEHEIFVKKEERGELEELKLIYPEMEMEKRRILARLCSGTKFMMELMQKISPIPLEVPMEIIEVSDLPKRPLLRTEWENSDDGKLKKTRLKINLETLGRTIDLFSKEENVDKYAEKLNLEKKISFEQAKAEAEKEKITRLRELDEYVMGAAVQEFAHMLYLQEALNKGSEKKVEGVGESMKHNLLASLMKGEDVHKEYLSLAVERRARLWALDFYRHLYPDSRYRVRIEEEIKEGNEFQEKTPLERGVS